MKKVDLINRTKRKKYEAKEPKIKSFDEIESIICLEKELWFYRHYCKDKWFEELLGRLNILGKKVDISIARRIILGSIRKRME